MGPLSQELKERARCAELEQELRDTYAKWQREIANAFDERARLISCNVCAGPRRATRTRPPCAPRIGGS